MSALTETAGYPAHAVENYSQEVTGHGVTITTWIGSCGATAQQTGLDPFRPAGQARRAELCKACFPGGHATYHPPARKVEEPAR